MNQVAKNAESMARSDLFDLSGKTALVTGGASGLGYAMAVGLARHGANVALLDIDGDSLERAVAALRAQGTEAEPIAGDVLVESEVAAAVASSAAAAGFGESSRRGLSQRDRRCTVRDGEHRAAHASRA